jgi:protein-tyrosine phosphatase
MLLVGLLACWVLAPAACGGAGDGLEPPDGGERDGTLGTDGPPGGDGFQTCARRVLEARVTNARELGDWPLPGDARVACRALMRGGSLAGLDGAGCDEFRALRLRTVIDLRDPASQAASPPPACVREQARVVAAPQPKLLPDTVQTYLALLEEHASIRAAFEALAESDALPAYVHCEIGRSRASVMAALLLLVLGAERATVLAEFDLSNAAGVEVHLEHLGAVLDALEARGGVEAYLTSIGVPSSQLEALRARARWEP